MYGIVCILLCCHCSVYVQWAKKLIHRRSNFACESNYGPENKDKPVGICDNKARYHILCCVKHQIFGFFCWFDIDFRRDPTQWISFLACTKMGLVIWYHMVKPKILCSLPPRVYTPPMGINHPLENMSSNTQQLLQLYSKMANPVTRWLPRCMSATLQFKYFTPLSKTACPSTWWAPKAAHHEWSIPPCPKSHLWSSWYWLTIQETFRPQCYPPNSH